MGYFDKVSKAATNVVSKTNQVVGGVNQATTSLSAITQSASAAEDVYAWTVKVQGYGAYTGVVYVTCTMSVQSNSTDLTASIDSGDSQTIWKNNQFSSVVIQTNAPNDMMTADTSDFPAGITWDEETRTISGDPYTALATGVNTFDLILTGTGGYSGSDTVTVTVTKRIPKDLTDVTYAIVGFDFAAGITSAANLVSEAASQCGEVVSATQVTASEQPYLSTLVNGKSAISFIADTVLDLTLAGGVIASPYSFFVGGECTFDNSQVIAGTSNNVVEIQMLASSDSITLDAGTTSLQFTGFTRDKIAHLNKVVRHCQSQQDGI